MKRITLVNFDKIVILQKNLDKLIYKNCKIKMNKELFDKRLLALVVEITELANEVKCFKYWSKNTSFKNNMDKIIDEYSDCLHFFVSIGNFINIDYKNLTVEITKINLSKEFLELIKNICKIKKIEKKFFLNCFMQFINLGVNLGLSLEQVYSGYIKKNKINFKRQYNNY